MIWSVVARLAAACAGQESAVVVVVFVEEAIVVVVAAVLDVGLWEELVGRMVYWRRGLFVHSSAGPSPI